MGLSTSHIHLRSFAMILIALGMVSVSSGSLAAQQTDSPQPASSPGSPLTELTFEGLLARNASWGYLSYLVRTRGLGFSPSRKVMEVIGAAGGGTLVSVLRTAKIIPAQAQSKLEQKLIQRLSHCAEL